MPATLNHPSTPTVAAEAGIGIARIAAGVLLTGLLFGATVYNGELYALFDAGWQWIMAATNLSQYVARCVEQGTGAGHLMHHVHSVPAVFSFGLLYVGVCIALQGVLLPQASQRQLVGWFYGGACGMALGLLLAGTLTGSTVLAELNKQLVHFVVSPLPVIVLVPLLRWYLPPPVPGRTTAAQPAKNKNL